ncbi:taurine ABC transporter ATP-binding protein [Novosphingobium sp. FKTRR1]|uniref:taurine ABC transporter ATP-binding protein n=1 Tax=unclassified Novosphingobium TaxID=2644732 RepID=UPI001CF015D8|nr:taurine ABC transporter ATP-binding protein [Novosphingobium sp. FKTRR1]
MARLSVENVSVTYGGKRGPVKALADVSVEVASGEIVVALGASGCGKSTLLGLMAGFLKPTAGAVQVDGVPIAGPGTDRAVVFQDDALMPWLSAEDNVAFGLQMRGFKQAERRAAAREMLAQVGLEGFAGHAIHEMSGGMRQRVGLARALAVKPDFLLMDEPLGALDELTRERMQMLILNLWQRSGKGIFLITHSIEEALFMASELVLLSPRPGRIVQRYQTGFARRFIAGEPVRAIKADPQFVAMREELANAILASEENEVTHVG